MKILFYLVLFLFLLTGASWLMQQPYFQISSIEIVDENGSGSLKFADKKKVFDSVKPYLTGSFFHVNVNNARRAAAQNEWIKSVKIDRIPPSHIKITVQEYTPVAKWIREGFQAGLVTANGEIFQANYQGKTSLPEFDGDVNEQKNMLSQYALFNSRIKSLRLQILRLQYTPRGAWTLMLDNGIEVRLGTGNVHTRMARFVEYYPSQLSVNASYLDYVDMRYPDAFAAKLRDDAPKPDTDLTDKPKENKD